MALLDGKQIRDLSTPIGGTNNKLIAQGTFDMGSHGITTTIIPTTGNDLTNKAYVDSLVSAGDIGGVNQSIQFNDEGTQGGDVNFLFDKANDAITLSSNRTGSNGVFSMVIGNNVEAGGDNSLAVGSTYTRANSNNSVAFGYQSQTIGGGNGSVAMGYYARANNATYSSIAIGMGGSPAYASGKHSFIAGFQGGNASGDYSIVLGGGQATTNYALSMGRAYSHASMSLAVGYATINTGATQSFATGASTIQANAQGSIATGNATITGNYSAAFGGGSTANVNSLAFSNGNASGSNALAGGNATVNGNHAFGMGNGISSGYHSFAFGNGEATAQHSFSIGNSEATGYHSFAAGNAGASAQLAFAFGNGSATEYQALSFGNGVASGNQSRAFGNGDASSQYSVSFQNATVSGFQAFGVGSGSASNIGSVTFHNSSVSGSNGFGMGFITTITGNEAFVGGKGVSTKAVTSSGDRAFNFSENNASQTVGHGALADNSVVLGGLNHNIPTTSPRSVVLGGDSIKVPASRPDEVFVPNLAIVDTPTINNSSSDILVWNPSTQAVERSNAFGTNGIQSAITETLSQSSLVVPASSNGDTGVNLTLSGSETVDGEPRVFINGILYQLGTAITGVSFFFTDDSGTSAISDFTTITSSSELYANTTAIGFDLDTNDDISVVWEKLS